MLFHSTFQLFSPSVTFTDVLGRFFVREKGNIRLFSRVVTCFINKMACFEQKCLATIKQVKWLKNICCASVGVYPCWKEYKNGQGKRRFLQDPSRWNAFSVHELYRNFRTPCPFLYSGNGICRELHGNRKILYSLSTGIQITQRIVDPRALIPDNS